MSRISITASILSALLALLPLQAPPAPTADISKPSVAASEDIDRPIAVSYLS